jgi:hypothetical protein
MYKIIFNPFFFPFHQKKGGVVLEKGGRKLFLINVFHPSSKYTKKINKR